MATSKLNPIYTTLTDATSGCGTRRFGWPQRTPCSTLLSWAESGILMLERPVIREIRINGRDSNG